MSNTTHNLLRWESEIVINTAVRRCALEGIWVVTIHDCLVTHPDQAERVKEIMIAAFESVGVRPTIKTTAFNVQAQDVRRSNPGAPVDLRSRLCSDLTDKAVGGLVMAAESDRTEALHPRIGRS